MYVVCKGASVLAVSYDKPVFLESGALYTPFMSADIQEIEVAVVKQGGLLPVIPADRFENDNGVIVVKPEFADDYAAALAAQKEAEIERMAADHTIKVQQHIDATAVSLGYDDANSIAKYLVDGNPFEPECKAISLWIAAVWVFVRQVQSDVLAGERVFPTAEVLIGELPKYTPPV